MGSKKVRKRGSYKGVEKQLPLSVVSWEARMKRNVSELGMDG
jgi:hypothetical protein